MSHRTVAGGKGPEKSPGVQVGAQQLKTKLYLSQGKMVLENSSLQAVEVAAPVLHCVEVDFHVEEQESSGNGLFSWNIRDDFGGFGRMVEGVFGMGLVRDPPRAVVAAVEVGQACGSQRYCCVAHGRQAQHLLLKPVQAAGDGVEDDDGEVRKVHALRHRERGERWRRRWWDRRTGPIQEELIIAGVGAKRRANTKVHEHEAARVIGKLLVCWRGWRSGWSRRRRLLTHPLGGPACGIAEFPGDAVIARLAAISASAAAGARFVALCCISESGVHVKGVTYLPYLASLLAAQCAARARAHDAGLFDAREGGTVRGRGGREGAGGSDVAGRARRDEWDCLRPPPGRPFRFGLPPRLTSDVCRRLRHPEIYDAAHCLYEKQCLYAIWLHQLCMRMTAMSCLLSGSTHVAN